MSDTKLSALLAVGGALALAIGCSAGVKATNPPARPARPGPTRGVDRPMHGGDGGNGPGRLLGGFGGNDRNGRRGPQSCTPTFTCTPPGGRYCNTIGNGCPGRSSNAAPVPAMPPAAAARPRPASASAARAARRSPARRAARRYCGKIGDGCGRELDCGACAGGQTCRGGLCVARELYAADLRHRERRQVLRHDRRRLRWLARLPGLQRAPDLRRRLHCGRVRHAAGSCTNRRQLQADGRPVLRRRRRQLRRHIDCGACDNGMACRTDHVCPSTGPGPCQNLQCQLDKPGECTGDGTTISGQVFDPGRARSRSTTSLLYVPNTALGPIPTGASCDRCDSPISGTPVAAALTRTGREVHDQERAVGDEHPARHPDRQVAAQDHPAHGHQVSGQRVQRSEPGAPAAQHERPRHGRRGR